MAENYFYKGRSGDENGPVFFDELAALAKSGRIAPDCLVWREGEAPVPAASMAGLAAAFQASAAGAPDGGPLRPSAPVWGLFWRGLVFVFGVLLIVPAPWAGKWFYGWLTRQIALPNGRRLFLETAVGECWYIFVGLAIAQIAPRLVFDADAILWVFAVSWIAVQLFKFLLIGWFSRALRSEDGATHVRFQGGFLPYLGWSVLIVLSLATIVGWAWVTKYQLRWICASTRGSHRFEFVASGWDLLWRVLALVFGGMLVLTIPWLLRWYANWFISQIVATPEAAQG